MASRFARVRSYELMVIFHPETEDEALAEQIDRVRSYVTGVDGTVTVVNRDNPWGRRRLAYPIRHESRDLRDGIYVLVYFDAEASRTFEIERELKLNTRIIRYMLIQQSTPTMEPPAPVEAAAPPADGQAVSADATPSTGLAVISEVSPGTPAEVTSMPVEPTVPEVDPAASTTEGTVPTGLESSPAPSRPSETLPPADASLADLVDAPEAPESTAPGAAAIPPEAVDLGESSGTADAESGDNEPNPSTPA